MFTRYIWTVSLLSGVTISTSFVLAFLKPAWIAPCVWAFVGAIVIGFGWMLAAMIETAINTEWKRR